MSALAQAAADYLRLRRCLGHKLADGHRLLPRFVAYLDSIGATTVTIEAALAWAQQPGVNPASSVGPRRMSIARGFARHMASIDPRTEVPPPGLIPDRHHRWRPPYIFSLTQIEALMAAASGSRWPLAAATYETIIGLLAATGMRVGEAIRLDRADVDPARAVLIIRGTKFGKSRYVPILPDTQAALDRYAQTRDRLCPRTVTTSFFVTMRGNRLVYQMVQQKFRRVCVAAGVSTDAIPRPRIHDLRHSFAVRTLLGWYHNGLDVETHLPRLSTYLGHRDPRSTYWYLSAAPELLALAAGRLELSRGVITR